MKKVECNFCHLNFELKADKMQQEVVGEFTDIYLVCPDCGTRWYSWSETAESFKQLDKMVAYEKIDMQRLEAWEIKKVKQEYRNLMTQRKKLMEGIKRRRKING